MDPKNSALEDIFKKSAPGSSYEKIYRNNLDEDSFHYNFDQAIQKLSEAEEALLVNWYWIREDERFCQLEEIWSTDFGHTSIALTKHLPYGRIFNHALNEFIWNGQFQRSVQLWSPQSLSCPPLPFNDLGFHKVVFLFSILIFGIALSLVMFIYERRSYKSNPSKHFESVVTLNINIKLNPEELQRLINIVEEIDGQNYELLIGELRSKHSNPP